MIVCRAASVWPPPESVTQVVCTRCKKNIPALTIIAAIWIDKLADEDESEHDWSAQMLCEPCVVAAIPLPLMGHRQ